MKLRVLVLGAGFGGLELTSILSESLPDQLDLTLIDKSDSFLFGFSKFDIMFGRREPASLRVPYRNIHKPGVRFRQESITSIDPETRRVTTDKATYESDVLVIALGADYDMSGTPGLVEGGNEYYSVDGVEKLRQVLPNFSKGHALIGVTSPSFKCPPAPSEAALLLHDYLSVRGARNSCSISLIMPFDVPIPPSPETSSAILAEFADRNITFVPDSLVNSLDPARKVAVLDTGRELPYDLFLGVPKHCVPDVVAKSGMTENSWIPVDKRTLKTKFPNVYAIGDVTLVGTPKAGVFSEEAAKIVAASLIADFRGFGDRPEFQGAGACYIEFGNKRVGRVDVDFFSGPKPKGTFTPPSLDQTLAKEAFWSSRLTRWFGVNS